jgi:ATP-dependent RNA helicase RhlE
MTAQILDANVPTQDFTQFGFKASVLSGIFEMGYTQPTAIQAAVIPVSLTGKDVIGLAQTGSGKTAAFVLPILQAIETGKPMQALILAPTREIAQQTQMVVHALGKAMAIKCACLIGGVKMNGQVSDVQAGPEVIVATPGRCMDFLERRLIDLRHLRILVLDEADHMLDMGFLPQVEKILKVLPRERQTLMFSATMPPAIERLTSRFLNDPTRVDVLPEGRTATGITHQLYMVDRNDKEACLIELIKQFPESTMVFTRMKIDADWVARVIERAGIKVGKLHSDLSQAERTRSLDAFRNREISFLVATNIASRGLDIPGVQHIIHFDVPESVEDYIHRSGRTARADSIGTVSSIATIFDKALIKAIEKEILQEIPRCSLPGISSVEDLPIILPVKRKKKW